MRPLGLGPQQAQTSPNASANVVGVFWGPAVQPHAVTLETRLRLRSIQQLATGTHTHLPPPPGSRHTHTPGPPPSPPPRPPPFSCCCCCCCAPQARCPPGCTSSRAVACFVNHAKNKPQHSPIGCLLLPGCGRARVGFTAGLGQGSGQSQGKILGRLRARLRAGLGQESQQG